MSCYSLSGVNFGNTFQGQVQSIFYDNILHSFVGRSMTYELRFSDLSEDTYS